MWTIDLVRGLKSAYRRPIFLYSFMVATSRGGTLRKVQGANLLSPKIYFCRNNSRGAKISRFFFFFEGGGAVIFLKIFSEVILFMGSL